VEFKALRGFGLSPSKKAFFAVSLVIWVKVLFDDNHCCSLHHTSCFHSMHPLFKDSANLVGSSGERFGVLLQSLRGDIFSGYGWFEEDVAWI